jgi:hypothetical protein
MILIVLLLAFGKIPIEDRVKELECQEACSFTQ